MLLVAGLSLKNLKPRVWDAHSPYYLPNLRAIMVSYVDFHRLPAARRRAMVQGLHAYLGTPEHTKIYLDNGAFYDTFHFPFPLCSHLQESCFLAKDWNFSDVVRV